MNGYEAAQQGQEKFDFYVISLVFTLLALSIQSAKFTGGIPANILELLGWLFLLISGIVGLWRLEHIPVIRYKIAIKQDAENFSNAIKEKILLGETNGLLLETGKRKSLDAILNQQKKKIDILTPIITKLENRNDLKYKIFKCSGVLGVICLVASRAYSPFLNILIALLKPNVSC